jgi:hypothetical protein
MKMLVCTADVVPCPPEFQVWLGVEDIFIPANVGISAGGIAEVFGWGFGVVIMLWALGYGIGAALKVIRLV